MFPLREKTHKMHARNEEEFKVNFANTKRLKISSIPFMQNELNSEVKIRRTRKPGWEKLIIVFVFSSPLSVPVNFCFYSFVVKTPSLWNKPLSLSKPKAYFHWQIYELSTHKCHTKPKNNGWLLVYQVVGGSAPAPRTWHIK